MLDAVLALDALVVNFTHAPLKLGSLTSGYLFWLYFLHMYGVYDAHSRGVFGTGMHQSHRKAGTHLTRTRIYVQTGAHIQDDNLQTTDNEPAHVCNIKRQGDCPADVAPIVCMRVPFHLKPFP